MAVLALMYHRTPQGEVTSDWDVLTSALRDQIDALRDAGFRFVAFKDALAPELYGPETFVSVTMDDGHESNLDAIDLLHDAGAPATAFIIADASRAGTEGYMTTKAIAEAADRCEFGGHGVTHTDLTSFSPAGLSAELRTVKSYLEDTAQRPVTTMSAPGGRINRSVVQEALRCGYQVIGSSRELTNAKPSHTLNRICVRQWHTPKDLVELAKASGSYWLRRKARLAAGRLVAEPMERLAPGLLNRIRDQGRAR